MMPSSTNRRGLVLRYKNGIAISMDGKGPWRDNNVSVERLWRSVKYGQGLRQRVRGPHIAIGLVHRGEQCECNGCDAVRSRCHSPSASNANGPGQRRI